MGRGGEIIFDGWGLKLPDELKSATKKTSTLTITPEQFDQYLGDYVIIAANGDQKAQFEETNVWKNKDDMKKNHEVKFDVKETKNNELHTLEKKRKKLNKNKKYTKNLKK